MTSVAQQAWFQNPNLRRVMDMVNRDGGEGRIVGGAVRNALMDMDIGDVDIATTLLPQEVMERAKKDGLKPVPTGLQHGTVTVVCNSEPFEITTLRTDEVTDGRHAEVRFSRDWQADADRRDLTVNALYADNQGEVIDLVGGIADIESRTIRFIGDADKRIAEDHLRILRFFRFFAYYGSGRPDAAGLKASARAKDSISKLSVERIWAEMKKLLAAPDPSRSLLWMRQMGVLGIVFPETEKWGIDAIHGLVHAGQVMDWRPDPFLRLAAIVPPDEERMRSLANRLKFSNAEKDKLLNWAKAPIIEPTMAATALDRLLYRNGTEGILIRLKLALSSAQAAHDGSREAIDKVVGYSNLLSRVERFERQNLPVNGADLIAEGIQPGPDLGRILAILDDKWVESNFTTSRDKLLELALQNKG